MNIIDDYCEDKNKNNNKNEIQKKKSYKRGRSGSQKFRIINKDKDCSIY